MFQFRKEIPEVLTDDPQAYLLSSKMVMFSPSSCACCMLSCSVVSNSLQTHGLQPARLHCLWDSPGKNTGVGCHFIPQGIFPIQDQTQASHLADGFFKHLRPWQVHLTSGTKIATPAAGRHPTSLPVYPVQLQVSSH